MSIRIDTYETDDYTTFTVEGVGVGPYTYEVGDKSWVHDRNDTFVTHRQNPLIAGGEYGEVTVMVLGTKADSEVQEKGYVHAKFTAAQAREIAEVLLAAAREFDNREEA